MIFTPSSPPNVIFRLILVLSSHHIKSYFEVPKYSVPRLFLVWKGPKLRPFEPLGPNPLSGPKRDHLGPLDSEAPLGPLGPTPLYGFQKKKKSRNLGHFFRAKHISLGVNSTVTAR